MVAANLPLTKIKKINNQKIVKVSWITDRSVFFVISYFHVILFDLIHKLGAVLVCVNAL